MLIVDRESAFSVDNGALSPEGLDSFAFYIPKCSGTGIICLYLKVFRV